MASTLARTGSRAAHLAAMLRLTLNDVPDIARRGVDITTHGPGMVRVDLGGEPFVVIGIHDAPGGRSRYEAFGDGDGPDDGTCFDGPAPLVAHLTALAVAAPERAEADDPGVWDDGDLARTRRIRSAIA